MHWHECMNVSSCPRPPTTHLCRPRGEPETHGGCIEFFSEPRLLGKQRRAVPWRVGSQAGPRTLWFFIRISHQSLADPMAPGSRTAEGGQPKLQELNGTESQCPEQATELRLPAKVRDSASCRGKNAALVPHPIMPQVWEFSPSDCKPAVVPVLREGTTNIQGSHMSISELKKKIKFKNALDEPSGMGIRENGA